MFNSLDLVLNIVHVWNVSLLPEMSPDSKHIFCIRGRAFFENLFLSQTKSGIGFFSTVTFIEIGGLNLATLVKKVILLQHFYLSFFF